jgi:ElaB/YqjD/DUF883 family membrane-anchored ribosome-binding protein
MGMTIQNSAEQARGVDVAGLAPGQDVDAETTTHAPASDEPGGDTARDEIEQLRKERDKALHEAAKLREREKRARLAAKGVDVDKKSEDKPKADVSDDVRSELQKLRDELSKVRQAQTAGQREQARALRAEADTLAKGLPDYLVDAAKKLPPADAVAMLQKARQGSGKARPSELPGASSGAPSQPLDIYELSRRGMSADEIRTKHPDLWKAAVSAPARARKTSLNRS